MIEQLFEAYHHLDQAAASLHQSIQEEARPGWICQKTAQPAYQAIAHSYSDWWYVGEDDGRKTVNYHGLILASPETITLAHAVNEQKQGFQRLVQEIQKTDKKSWLESYPLLIPSHRRDTLKSANLTRLHLKQCYRQIPILPSRPEKIGFSWYCSGKSIKQVSKAEAIERLDKLGNAKHLRVQRSKLAALPDSERLAIVQPQAPCVRANIVYRDDNIIYRKACNSPLPFLIPSSEETLPTFNQIEHRPPNKKTRLQRSDIKIAETAIAPSIRAYRYQ